MKNAKGSSAPSNQMKHERRTTHEQSSFFVDHLAGIAAAGSISVWIEIISLEPIIIIIWIPPPPSPPPHRLLYIKVSTGIVRDCWMQLS